MSVEQTSEASFYAGEERWSMIHGNLDWGLDYWGLTISKRLTEVKVAGR
jgi:hypothetical protein